MTRLQRDDTEERYRNAIDPRWARPETILTPRFALAPLRRPEFEAYLYAYDEFQRAWRLPEPSAPLLYYERRALQALYLKGLAYDAANYVWGTLWLALDRASGVETARLFYKGAPRLRAVEVAYSVRRAARNSGVMTETLRAACEWLRARDDADVMLAETTVKNAASQRVLEKVGFQRARATKAYLLWRWTAR